MSRNLSFARPGGGTVCLDTSSVGGDVNGVRERSLAHASQRLASGGSLAVFLVRGEVEGDEEDQI